MIFYISKRIKFKSENNKSTLCKHTTLFINTFEVYKNQFGESLLWLNASFLYSPSWIHRSVMELASKFNFVALEDKQKVYIFIGCCCCCRCFWFFEANKLSYLQSSRKCGEEIQQIHKQNFFSPTYIYE